jgi:predicted MFS family arabinose efflux permease
MFIYLQPVYLKEYWNADPVMIGVILSVMGVFMTAAQIPAGWLSDRIGPLPGMRGSWILGASAAVLMAVGTTLPVFLTGMFLYGFTSFVIAPMSLYMTGVRGNWSIERALTVPNAAFNAGMVIGSLSGGVIGGVYGFRWVYTISAVIFWISTLVVLFCRKPPLDEHHEITAHRPNLFMNRRFIGLLGLIFITFFALYFPQPLTSIFFAGEVQLSLPIIGLLGSIGFLGNTVITFAFQRLSAPIGFLAGQVFVAVYAFVLWQAGSPIWFGIGVFFIGGYRLARAMSLAYARRFIRASETGMAYGLIETANGAVCIMVPYIASLIYVQGPRLVYAVSFVLICAVILINLAVQPDFRRGSSLEVPVGEGSLHEVENP